MFETIKSFTLWCIFINALQAETILSNYYNERRQLIDSELEQSVGGRIILNPAEVTANECLMRLKIMILDNDLKSPENFKLSQSYLAYRDSIKDSKIYQIIRKMPKGALLHLHSSLMMDADYILTLTYEEHLYACFENKDDIKLLFSAMLPQQPCLTEWALLSKIRSNQPNIEKFDEDLKKHFSLPYNEVYEDINSIWRKFDKVYNNLRPLLRYRPVRERYWYDSLKRLYDDNVLYVEIRTGLHQLHELDGTTHDYMYMARLLHRITKEFKDEYPDFIGAKLILTVSRKEDNLEAALDKAYTVKEEMPDFFAGFDLVGQEDKGKPLLNFLPALSKEKERLNFFFHGGETNWYGSSTDENLVDAILLGTKRIGHGYALLKHPALLEEVRTRGIAIEVNVISNEVLGLVHDVRNHPLSLYLAMDLPVVLSSDDPGVWGAQPLTDDFFVTFMGVASRRAGLRTLKQLALNSIKYSAMDSKAKSKALRVFWRKWKVFIDEVNDVMCASKLVDL